MPNIRPWGFEEQSGLGGDSALSMPGERAIPTYGTPQLAAQNQSVELAQQVQREYNGKSGMYGTVFDPRGMNAVTANNVSDAWRGKSGAPIKDIEQEARSILYGGNAVAGNTRPRNNVAFKFAKHGNLGLSDSGIRSLADSLASYDRNIVETIKLPEQPGLPRISNELGLTSVKRSLRSAIDSNIAKRQQDLNDAGRIKRLTSSTIVRSDDNGVISGFAPGTGAYDAPGRTRPAGVSGLVSGDGYTSIPNSGRVGSVGESAKTGNIIGYVGVGILAVTGVWLLVTGMK